ncbi:hypothetical protein V2J09_001620 [Rumex salicifolius]
MRIVVKLIDLALFLFFLFTAIVAPLLDSQKVLPPEYYPKQLLDLNAWYANEYGDYLVSDNPHFFVGVIWNELLVIWPLAIANLVGIISGKSWFNTTCLIFGANCFGSMLLYSGRSESDRFLMIYAPFMGVAALAVIRGLITVRNRRELCKLTD